MRHKKKNPNRKRTLTHHFIFVQVFTVSLSFWLHMLCKKELYRSATEDSRKFLYVICTNPVQITVSANFSWFPHLYAWNWKILRSEICYCEKGSSTIGINMEDYFHHAVVYYLQWLCKDQDCQVSLPWTYLHLQLIQHVEARHIADIHGKFLLKSLTVGWRNCKNTCYCSKPFCNTNLLEVYADSCQLIAHLFGLYHLDCSSCYFEIHQKISNRQNGYIITPAAIRHINAKYTEKKHSSGVGSIKKWQV